MLPNTSPSTNNPQSNESFATNYLDPQAVHFRLAEYNLTYTAADGAYYPRVTLRRSFPLSAENAFIAVRTTDATAERTDELGIIADCTKLDAESRAAVEHELRLFYLVPNIQCIHSIREEFGFLYWDVVTDRGPKQFIMRDSIIGQVRQVGPGRWLIIDINQTRYEVHNFEALDEQSQRLLNRYLLL